MRDRRHEEVRNKDRVIKGEREGDKNAVGQIYERSHLECFLVRECEREGREDKENTKIKTVTRDDDGDNFKETQKQLKKTHTQQELTRSHPPQKS